MYKLRCLEIEKREEIKKVRCPHCKTNLRVFGEFKMVTCNECSRKFKV